MKKKTHTKNYWNESHPQKTNQNKKDKFYEKENCKNCAKKWSEIRKRMKKEKYNAMVWFGLVLWHINYWRLSNDKSSLYIYIKYIWFVNILLITLNKPKLILCTQLNGFKYFYLLRIILFTINHLFVLYRWFNKGIPQVQAEELASLSESD